MLVTDDDDDGGAVRTYNCFTPHCRWMMEDLQWFDSSLVDEGVMRTYSGLTPRSLLGGGVVVVTSYVSFTGHGVGPLLFPFGGSTSATKVHFTQQ